MQEKFYDMHMEYRYGSEEKVAGRGDEARLPSSSSPKYLHDRKKKVQQMMKKKKEDTGAGGAAIHMRSTCTYR